MRDYQLPTDNKGKDESGYRAEFIQLVKLAFLLEKKLVEKKSVEKKSVKKSRLLKSQLINLLDKPC